MQDYASLLRLSGDYTVMEMEVQPDDWLADKELAELGLRQEGVVVLGIQRENGRYVGAPKGHTHICPGDVLILYGRLPLLNELDQRGAGWTGEQSHQKAVAQQQRNLAKQDREEAEDNQRERRFQHTKGQRIRYELRKRVGRPQCYNQRG
ncbi:MAG: TrkA C-terminal domain-containing protein [Coleofasciculus sp. F4-SAH-05]